MRPDSNPFASRACASCYTQIPMKQRDLRPILQRLALLVSVAAVCFGVVFHVRQQQDADLEGADGLSSQPIPVQLNCTAETLSPEGVCH